MKWSADALVRKDRESDLSPRCFFKRFAFIAGWQPALRLTFEEKQS